MTSITWLTSTLAKTRSLVGGKAASLSGLVAEGLRVPSGFSINSDMIDLEINRISREVGFDLLSLDNWRDIELRNGENSDEERFILEAIRSHRWNPDVINEVIGAATELGYPLAVRSSGLGEDGIDKSSAGIYDSILGIQDVNELKSAIGEVLVSAFKAPCRRYFSDTGVERLLGFSILIQKMIEPEVSGCCITQASNDGELDFVHIELVLGHNEIIADGTVTPSSYTIDAFDLSELQVQPTRPEIRVDYRRGVRAVTNLEDEDVVPFDFLLKVQLVDICKKCSLFFGGAQEIEWMLEGGEIYLVQSRPMTSDINQILADNWRSIINREYGVQYASVSIDSLNDKGHPILDGFSLNQLYIPYDTGFLSCVMKRKDWLNFSRFTQRFISEDGVAYLAEVFEGAATDYLSFCAKLRELPLADYSSEALRELYQRHQFLAKRYCTFIWLCYVASNRACDAIQYQLYAAYGDREDFNEIVKAAQSPDEESIVARRYPEMLAVTPEDGAEFDLLLRTYPWVPCLDIHFPPLNENSLREAIKDQRSIPKESSEPINIEQILSPEELDFVRVVKRLVTIRDKRDDYRRQCVWHLRQTLISEIAARANCTIEEISFWSEEEVEGYLLTQSLPDPHLQLSDHNYLKQRFAVAETEGTISRIEGDELEKLLEVIVLEAGNNNKPGFITGRVARAGVVTGTVRKIRGAHELNNVGDGEILVAHTTHPDFVLAMRRAGAIITDEGGCGSHAAQVAREYDIPCIIGAQSAMEHLVDGVEAFVDAGRGIVKQKQ